jgi:PAT family acetyl-CoA transporter-like MFS transporter 1
MVIHEENLQEINTQTIISTKKYYEISLLVFLYFLQGLVFGLLLETIQLNLKSSFSYSEIGIYLMCSYPFSLKILWSPIVDTYYFNRLGLRKTWIIISQLISSLILIYLSNTIEEMIKEKQIYLLGTICFILVFCISIQDIAVDGWALSLCGNDVHIYNFRVGHYLQVVK